MRYLKKRFYEWSPGIAYAVGLLTSDGCLQKDERHIDLTSIDIDQIQNFLKSIDRTDLNISQKVYKGQKNAYYRVQFSDVSLYDFLLNAGLHPNKSLTIEEVKVPDHLFHHYLRGFFDGDGTVYGYTDKRWRSSTMYYMGFTCANRLFLENLSKRCSILAGTRGHSIRKSVRSFSLVYAKEDSRKLFDFMYKDADTYLERKYEKIKRFIITDRDATIYRQNARVA